MKKAKQPIEKKKDDDDEWRDPECDCERRGCKRSPCKGECGCQRCHNDYQDFLSCDYD